ncbi:MAG: hypothetical protein LBR15_08355 [Methanobrevibacter sp.]|jgi:hypothetical protein|nr:hypothetical protein [Candidatus Methanovirga australis]
MNIKRSIMITGLFIILLNCFSVVGAADWTVSGDSWTSLSNDSNSFICHKGDKVWKTDKLCSPKEGFLYSAMINRTIGPDRNHPWLGSYLFKRVNNEYNSVMYYEASIVGSEIVKADYVYVDPDNRFECYNVTVLP